MTTAHHWTWSDGWILMSLYLAGRDQGAELHEIIAAADATNHAIPTTGEMSRALTKLMQFGLIRAHDDRFWIIGDHLHAIKQAAEVGGGLFLSGDKGVKWLQETPLTKKSADRIELSNTDLETAFHRYRKAILKR